MSVVGTIWAELRLRAEQFQRDLQGATNRVQSAGQRMEQSGARLAAVGGTLTRSLTLPIVGVGIAAGKAAMDFDVALSRIVGLVGISRKQVDEWGKELLELGPKIGKSPAELADALFTITSAGFRGAEALKVLEAAAKASAAGLGETRSIAEAVTGAINAYGAETLKASDATDILVATARAGNFRTEELAGSLGRVTPFAQAANVAFDDLGGAIALLTRVNNDANESVTQVSALLRAFSAPTKQTIKALEELGLSTTEVRDLLGTQGLARTLQILDERLGGNRDKLREIIPDSQGFSAALQILNADGKVLEETFGAVAESTGLTQGAFEAFEDTARAKFDKAMAQVQSTLITVGGEVLPKVTPIIEKLGEVVKSVATVFGGLPAPVQTGILAFLGFVAAIGPVLFIAGKLMQTTGLLLQGLSKLGRVPVVVAKAFSFLRTGIALVGKSFTFLAAHPIFLALIALALIAFLIIKNWDTVKEWFGLWLDGLKAAWDAVWSALSTGARAAADFFIVLWEGVKGVFSTVWEGIKSIVSRAIDFLKTVIGFHPVAIIIRNWGRITAFFAQMLERVKGFFVGAFDRLRSIASHPVEWIRAVWERLVGFFAGIPGRIWNQLQRVGNFFSRAVEMVRGAIDRIKRIVESILGPIVRTVEKIAGALGKLAFWRRSPSELEVMAKLSTQGALASFADMQRRMAQILADMRPPDLAVQTQLVGAARGVGGRNDEDGGLQVAGPLLQISGPITIRSEGDIERLSRALAKDVTDTLRARGRTRRRDERSR